MNQYKDFQCGTKQQMTMIYNDFLDTKDWVLHHSGSFCRVISMMLILLLPKGKHRHSLRNMLVFPSTGGLPGITKTTRLTQVIIMLTCVYTM